MSLLSVITGASSGMGRATAEKFYQMGYEVVIADISQQKLDDIAREIDPSKVFPIKVDVSSEDSVRQLALAIKEKYQKVDVLVNCAGVFEGGVVHESEVRSFDFQFDVNVKGTFLMMKYLIPFMSQQGEPSAIVNISSVSGINGDYNAALYCASKAAVIGLTKAAALDYAGKGIRINCISPSATKTPMFLNGSSQEVIRAFEQALPDHQLGTPQHIAQGIYFLASSAAEHIVGVNLPVDGGLSAWNGQPKQDKQEQ